uniref:Uncharacterized protein n=1 Tax=Romanomermis culicivorax TaxID=13658 RepID=A0A915JFZ3_ROMCU
MPEQPCRADVIIIVGGKKYRIEMEWNEKKERGIMTTPRRLLEQNTYPHEGTHLKEP